MNRRGLLAMIMATPIALLSRGTACTSDAIAIGVDGGAGDDLTTIIRWNPGVLPFKFRPEDLEFITSRTFTADEIMPAMKVARPAWPPAQCRSRVVSALAQVRMPSPVRQQSGRSFSAPPIPPDSAVQDERQPPLPSLVPSPIRSEGER